MNLNYSSWFSGALDATKRQAQETINYANYAVGNKAVDENDPFEKKYKQFKTYVDDVENVNQSFQCYIDAVDALSASFVMLGESITKLHGNSHNADSLPSPMENVTEIFRTIQKDINDNIRTSVHDMLTEKCVKPVMHILAQVPEIEKKYQRRKSLVNEHDYYKSKVQLESATQLNNYSSRSTGSTDSFGASRLLQEKVRELAMTQMEIEVSLEEFETVRSSMLGPELAALVGTMYYYTTSVGCLYSQLFPLLPQSTSNFATLVAKTGISSLPPTALNVKAAIGTRQNSYNKIQYLKTSGKFKHYIIEPTLSRPDILGGQTGGYDLLPGLHETRVREMEYSAANAAAHNENVPMTPQQQKQQLASASSAGSVVHIDGTQSPVRNRNSYSSDDDNEYNHANANAHTQSFHSPASESPLTHDQYHYRNNNHSRDTDDSPHIYTNSYSSPSPVPFSNEQSRSSSMDVVSANSSSGNTVPAVSSTATVLPGLSPVVQSTAAASTANSASNNTTANNANASKDKPKADADVVLMRVVALFDFDSEEPGDLTFQGGEIIEVLQQNSTGWWKGRIPLTSTVASDIYNNSDTRTSYRIGVFPYNFVEIEKSD